MFDVIKIASQRVAAHAAQPRRADRAHERDWDAKRPCLCATRCPKGYTFGLVLVALRITRADAANYAPYMRLKPLSKRVRSLCQKIAVNLGQP